MGGPHILPSDELTQHAMTGPEYWCIADNSILDVRARRRRTNNHLPRPLEGHAGSRPVMHAPAWESYVILCSHTAIAPLQSSPRLTPLRTHPSLPCILIFVMTVVTNCHHCTIRDRARCLSPASTSLSRCAWMPFAAYVLLSSGPHDQTFCRRCIYPSDTAMTWGVIKSSLGGTRTRTAWARSFRAPRGVSVGDATNLHPTLMHRLADVPVSTQYICHPETPARSA